MFINHIYRHAQVNPGKAAVVTNGTPVSYARFACAIEAARNHLMRAGLPGHGVVVRLTRNLYHEWVLLLAARSLGHTTVSAASWQVIESLDLKTITGMICLPDEQEAIAQVRRVRPDCVIAAVPRQVLEAPIATSLPMEVQQGRFGDHIVYTSGTTGIYKKLLQDGDWDEDLWRSDSQSIAESCCPDDAYYLHGYGPWSAAGYRLVMSCWGSGATVIFDQRKEFYKYFQDYPISKAFFVPGLLEQLRLMDKRRTTIDEKLTIIVGGGFLDERAAADVQRQFGCRLVMAYAATEFRTVLENQVECADDLVWLSPTHESGIEIVDDDGIAAEAGVPGNIRIALRSCKPDKYLDDPEATARHFRNGWFYPGDLAIRRADGRIRVLGRVADVLNLGGSKVPIGPVEHAARKALGVENLCIFALQTEVGQDLVVVAIEGGELPDQVRLETMAREVLGAPRVRFFGIDRFPRGDNGMMKVNRRKVLELVRASLEH